MLALVLCVAAGARSYQGEPPGSGNGRQSGPVEVIISDPIHPPSKKHDSSPPRPEPEPPRAGYCLNGVFLDLLLGQPDYDPLYAGAVPALNIPDVGITCDVPPGLAGHS